MFRFIFTGTRLYLMSVGGFWGKSFAQVSIEMYAWDNVIIFSDFYLMKYEECIHKDAFKDIKLNKDEVSGSLTAASPS